MPRTTGTYRVTRAGNEEVRAFVPMPLPPADPPLALDETLMALHAEAVTAVGKLSVAGATAIEMLLPLPCVCQKTPPLPLPLCTAFTVAATASRTPWNW